jgi:fluoroacetyl-CoA thioesterase
VTASTVTAASAPRLRVCCKPAAGQNGGHHDGHYSCQHELLLRIRRCVRHGLELTIEPLNSLPPASPPILEVGRSHARTTKLPFRKLNSILIEPVERPTIVRRARSGDWRCSGSTQASDLRLSNAEIHMQPIPIGAKGEFTLIVKPEHLANRF